MSFYTELIFYRPCEPPTISAHDLGQFIDQVHKAGLLRNDGFRTLQVRFGSSIDQDEEPITRLDEVTQEPDQLAWKQLLRKFFQPHVTEVESLTKLYTPEEIDWDLELSEPKNVAEMTAVLKNNHRRIYRAFVSLGQPIDTVLTPITRTNSPENECDFYPDSLNLTIGPITLGGLGCDTPLFVGWLGISLAGNGYLFPWSLRDVLHRLENTPDIKRIMQLCREFWPLPETPPEEHIIDIRKQVGDLWPYTEFDKPWNWYWGFAEG